MKSELYELKWKKFLKRVRLFRLVPFVEFVLAAGSLATGKVHEGSDFDVMVGVRQGRIFTARFFSVAIFELFGYRRKGTDHKGNVSDKICLNHFVTERAYKLRPPYGGTWMELYQSLVPVMGNEEKIERFFEVNDWMDPKRVYRRDARYIKINSSPIKELLEWIFRGRMGDGLEKVFKRKQIARIETGLPKALGHKGRVFWSDDELEFHPDRSKFEE